jgi:hypothetical protein
MTTHAFGRQSLTIELADGTRGVAGIAICHGVRSNQRETILMLIHRMDRDLPPAHPVAQVALCSISPAVNVRMAILAIPANIREYRMRVALLAGHGCVQSAQGITGFVVIEVRLLANRLPCRCGMT